MSKTPHIVLCTCPDLNTAEQLAQLLVEKQLAACVNIVPHLTSFYRDKGKLEKTSELLLVIKTCIENYGRLETTIRKNHPYKVPEIIVLPIKSGSSDYLNWITENVTLETE